MLEFHANVYLVFLKDFSLTYPLFILSIKNWLTFLNFNLFNQNIVNSQAVMTVNYDKASPSAHM